MARGRISLWCTEGGSDKTYTLWLEKDAKGFWVKYLYGPRGGTQTPGTKNKAALAEPKAEKLYDSILKEKFGKGYKPLGGDVPEYVEVKEATDTGLRPMLLTDLSGEDPEPFLKSPDWGAQQKMNGKRIMIRVMQDPEKIGYKVVGSNRRGLECPIPKAVAGELDGVGFLGEFDGELIGDTYHVFDMLANSIGADFKKESCTFRAERLRLRLNGQKFKNIRLVPLVVEEAEKRALYKKLMKENQEGIVFKRLDGIYEPGRRENVAKAIAVKVKFYKEVNAYVIDWTDKQSIEVGLRDGVGVTPVGKVTVPTKYVDKIERGSIVRVKYLYATAAKQLYQAHLDPTADGSVIADAVNPDPIKNLKFEGKEEE